MIKKAIVYWHETKNGKLYRKTKKYKAYQKAYQKEYQKTYRKTKKYKSYLKKYNKANRKRISAYNKAYYRKNKINI